MIAAKKLPETFSLLIALCVVYALTIYDVGNFVNDAELSQYTNYAVTCVPFFGSIANVKPTILTQIAEHFPLFSRHMLEMFLLAVITTVVTQLTWPLCRKLSSVSFFLMPVSWLLRFFFCNVAAVGYLMLNIYVIRYASASLLSVLSYLIFVFTLLVIITPIVEYFIVAAGAVPHPVLKALSNFAKERKLGGNLQSIFFASFLLTGILICTQLAGLQFFPEELQNAIAVFFV